MNEKNNNDSVDDISTATEEKNNTKRFSKKKLLVFTLILIAAAVAVIFVIKNSGQTSSLVEENDSKYTLDATEDFNLEEILSYGVPVIIDFGAEGCVPCDYMAPILKELNEELRGKAIVKFVNIRINEDAARAVPIRVIPTQFFFDKDGKPYMPTGESDIPFIQYQDKDTEEIVFTGHEGVLEKDQILSILEELGME